MNSTKFYFKSLVLISALCFTNIGIAQEETEEKDRDLKIEIEPASFFLRGAAGSVSYNITKDNNFALGAYAASVDVPVFPRARMFDNTVGEDTSDVRLGFQIALMARYRINVFKDLQSNPYVGLIAGWEYFDVTQPSTTGPVRLKTWLVTPYVGYEFYVLKKMLYINPQIRSVIYFGKGTDNPARSERIGNFLLLPQISLGVRI